MQCRMLVKLDWHSGFSQMHHWLQKEATAMLHVAQMARVVLIYTKSDAALSCIPQ